MQATPLTTKSGKPASRFSFGTMQFGGKADERQSREMYEASRAAGINFFDTAYVYTQGRAEALLGQFANHEPEDLLIATKCASVGGSGAANIRSQLEESRQRLAMDTVDIFYLHKWDDTTPLEESLTALAELRAAGLFRYIGVSNFSAWQTMKAACVAEKLGVQTRRKNVTSMYPPGIRVQFFDRDTDTGEQFPHRRHVPNSWQIMQRDRLVS